MDKYEDCKHCGKSWLDMYKEYGADELLLCPICQQEQIKTLTYDATIYRKALEKIALRDSDDWIAEMTAEIAKDALEPVSEEHNNLTGVEHNNLKTVADSVSEGQTDYERCEHGRVVGMCDECRNDATV